MSQSGPHVLTDYGFSILKADPLVAAFAARIPSDEGDGKSYDVSLLADYEERLDRYGDLVDVMAGTYTWSCECGDHVRRGNERCKHIERAKAIHRARQRHMRCGR